MVPLLLSVLNSAQGFHQLAREEVAGDVCKIPKDSMAHAVIVRVGDGLSTTRYNAAGQGLKEFAEQTQHEYYVADFALNNMAGCETQSPQLHLKIIKSQHWVKVRGVDTFHNHRSYDGMLSIATEHQFSENFFNHIGLSAVLAKTGAHQSDNVDIFIEKEKNTDMEHWTAGSPMWLKKFSLNWCSVAIDNIPSYDPWTP